MPVNQEGVGIGSELDGDPGGAATRIVANASPNPKTLFGLAKAISNLLPDPTSQVGPLKNKIPGVAESSSSRPRW